MKKIRYCRSDKVFYTISGIFLALLLLLVAYPLIYVLSASFSSGNAVSAGRVVLWPVDFSLEGYKAVFNKSDIWPAYLNTILIMNQIDYSTVGDPELILKMGNLGDVLKYALIVVSTVPILCVYPFVQKYFVKGVMIGSLKG